MFYFFIPAFLYAVASLILFPKPATKTECLTFTGKFYLIAVNICVFKKSGCLSII
jgi:hypothetical protein